MSEEKKSMKGSINSVEFDTAMEMTARWQALINPNTQTGYPKSYTFDKVDFLEILNEENVRSVRIYPGVHEDGTVTLLAVGVDHDNTDILHANDAASGIFDFATPCPNTCGNSPLNHVEE